MQHLVELDLRYRILVLLATVFVADAHDNAGGQSGIYPYGRITRSRRGSTAALWSRLSSEVW